MHYFCEQFSFLGFAMGNCPTPSLDQDNAEEEEVQRCSSGSCTSIQPIGTKRQKNNNKAGHVIINDVQVWENGIIPYELNYSLDYNKHRIFKAMRTIEKYSRMTFTERSDEETYLEISKQDGCYFLKGDGFRQPRVSLGIGCEDFGTVIHELMHAIGFPHEQRRPDRDDYIIVHWENIQHDSKPQYRKLKDYEYFWSEFPFDYNSVMLYEEYAFSKNGFKTIEARNGRSIHRKTNLSEIDKLKLGSL